MVAAAWGSSKVITGMFRSRPAYDPMDPRRSRMGNMGSLAVAATRPARAFPGPSQLIPTIG